MLSRAPLRPSASVIFSKVSGSAGSEAGSCRHLAGAAAACAATADERKVPGIKSSRLDPSADEDENDEDDEEEDGGQGGPSAGASLASPCACTPPSQPAISGAHKVNTR